MSTEILDRCPVRHDHVLPQVDFFAPSFKAAAHDAYASLRRDAPVHRTRFRDGRPLWLVTRHDDVLAVLKDARFVKSRLSCLEPHEIASLPKLPPVMRYVTIHMLGVDPPEHTRLRRLVMRAFSPRVVEGLRPRVQAIADALLDTALPRGRIELVGDYAFPLPITVIAELLGVPVADRERLRDWSNTLIANVGVRDARAIGALAQMLEAFSAYLRALFAAKRVAPGDDLISRLLQPADDGERLDEDELIAMLIMLVAAGHKTTTHLIGNGVLALLRHPLQMARLVADPSLLPRAVDELLRYDGPVETSTLRYAREDVERGGATIPRGELVMAVLSSANRDAAQFADGDGSTSSAPTRARISRSATASTSASVPRSRASRPRSRSARCSSARAACGWRWTRRRSSGAPAR